MVSIGQCCSFDHLVVQGFGQPNSVGVGWNIPKQVGHGRCDLCIFLRWEEGVESVKGGLGRIVCDAGFEPNHDGQFRWFWEE